MTEFDTYQGASTGGCILLRSLLGLYYSGCQSQQSFLLLSPSTHSLHVSVRAGHLQVNFPAKLVIAF
jgi:hypothetical protein